MMNTRQMSGSEAWTECERHWDGIFANTPNAEQHRINTYNTFNKFIEKFG